MGSQRRSLPPLPFLRVRAAAFGPLWVLVGLLLGSASGVVPFPSPAGAAGGGDAGLSADGAESGRASRSNPPGYEPGDAGADGPVVDAGEIGLDDAVPSGLGPNDPICLQHVREELRGSCGRSDLRISWSLSETVAARLHASPNAQATRVQGDGCDDRVVVQVTLGEGAATNRYLLTGEVEIWGPGLRAKRTLRAGTLLSPEDVTEGDGWFPPSAVAGESVDIDGAHVVRAIPMGHVVTSENIGPPPLVRRGETVRVVYRSRGLELRTVGTARRDGWIGDRLAVRAEGAQHDCTGTVAGQGVVQVDSEGGRR